MFIDIVLLLIYVPYIFEEGLGRRMKRTNNVSSKIVEISGCRNAKKMDTPILYLIFFLNNLKIAFSKLWYAYQTGVSFLNYLRGEWIPLDIVGTARTQLIQLYCHIYFKKLSKIPINDKYALLLEYWNSKFFTNIMDNYLISMHKVFINCLRFLF